MNLLTTLLYPRLQKQDTTLIHQVYSLGFVQVLVRKMKDTTTLPMCIRNAGLSPGTSTKK